MGRWEGFFFGMINWLRVQFNKVCTALWLTIGSKMWRRPISVGKVIEMWRARSQLRSALGFPVTLTPAIIAVDPLLKGRSNRRRGPSWNKSKIGRWILTCVALSGMIIGMVWRSIGSGSVGEQSSLNSRLVTAA